MGVRGFDLLETAVRRGFDKTLGHNWKINAGITYWY
jgi:hypothetical protein